MGRAQLSLGVGRGVRGTTVEDSRGLECSPVKAMRLPPPPTPDTDVNMGNGTMTLLTE